MWEKQYVKDMSRVECDRCHDVLTDEEKASEGNAYRIYQYFQSDAVCDACQKKINDKQRRDDEFWE